MFRRLGSLIAVIAMGLGVVTTAQAQYGQSGVKSEAAKPGAPARTNEAKKPGDKAKTVAGTVKSVDATTLVVRASGKAPREYTFELPGATIQVGGKEGTSTDLKSGDAVRVTYTESDGKLVAKTVSAKPAKAKK